MKTLNPLLATVLAALLLAPVQTARAVEFTYQPLTGSDMGIGVLYNVAIADDIVTFSIDTGLNRLYAHNIGTGETLLLSSDGFWTPNTPTVYGHHLLVAHDFKIGTPFTPAQIVDFDLRALTSSVFFNASGYDTFKAMDVAYPNLAALRFANDQPQPFYTYAISFELHNLVSGERTVIEAFDKADLHSGGHIRDTAFDGNFAAWIWCPDYGCNQSTLWAQDIATGDRYEILSAPAGTQLRWLDMQDNVLIYTTGLLTGMQATTISAVNLVSGQMWDITSSAGLIQYQQIDGQYLVWESYEPPVGCTGAECYAIENVFLYSLATGQITKVTDEPGRHYFQDIQGDRIAYIDNVAGYERLMLAEFEIVASPKFDAQVLCDEGREILPWTQVVRSTAWSSVTDLQIPATQLCGPSALCVRNGDADGNWKTRQAVLSVDGKRLLDGRHFNYSVRALAEPIDLTSGQASELFVNMGDIPGSTIAVRVATSWCDGDGDGFAADVDCDDSNPAIHPGATELCDGIDNDCDAATADGLAEPWLGQSCSAPGLFACMQPKYQCSAGVQACMATTPGACSCVSNLAARAKSGQVQLTWSPSAQATSHNVYRSTLAGGPYALRGNTSSSYATWLDTGLTNNTPYYYVVRPVAADSLELCQSNEAGATPTLPRGR